MVHLVYINLGGVLDKLCPGIADLSGPTMTVLFFMYMYVYTSEYRDGGGLASSIVAQEGSDLTLIHVQTQFIHCHLPPTSSKQSLQQYTIMMYMQAHTHVCTCIHNSQI